MYESIVAATDGSAPAEKAVRLAGELASAEGRRLILTYVVDSKMSRDELRRFAEAEHLISERPDQRTKEPVVLPHGEAPVPTTLFSGEDVDWVAVENSVGERILQQALEIANEQGARQVEVVLGRGEPAEEILRLAERSQADAIVLGSRGMRGVLGTVLGSVSQKVSSRAERTCITVT